MNPRGDVHETRAPRFNGTFLKIAIYVAGGLLLAGVIGAVGTWAEGRAIRELVTGIQERMDRDAAQAAEFRRDDRARMDRIEKKVDDWIARTK